MRKLAFIIITTITFLGCGSEAGESNFMRNLFTEEKTSEMTDDYDTLFSGNKFRLSAKFDEDICESVDYCDCCSYELIFLNQNKFVQVTPCGPIDYYTGGIYSYDNGILELQFKNSLFPDECRSGPLSADQEAIINRFLKKISEAAHYSSDTCNNMVVLNSSSLKYNDRGLISNQDLDKKVDYINSKILSVLNLE